MTVDIAVALPLGWIEVAAQDTVDEMAEQLRAQAAVDGSGDGDAFDEASLDALVDAATRLRATVGSDEWQHFGAVVTQVPAERPSGPDDEVPWRSTVWAYGVRLIRLPDLGDLNPVGVAERVVGSVGVVRSVDPFRLDDGRDGVAVQLTAVELDDEQIAAARAGLPQLDPDRLGAWVCMLPVPGLPGTMALTVGLAPNDAEVPPMTWLGSQIATSVHRVAAEAEAPAAAPTPVTTGVGGEGQRR